MLEAKYETLKKQSKAIAILAVVAAAALGPAGILIAGTIATAWGTSFQHASSKEIKDKLEIFKKSLEDVPVTPQTLPYLLPKGKDKQVNYMKLHVLIEAIQYVKSANLLDKQKPIPSHSMYKNYIKYRKTYRKVMMGAKEIVALNLAGEKKVMEVIDEDAPTDIKFKREIKSFYYKLEDGTLQLAEFTIQEGIAKEDCNLYAFRLAGAPPDKAIKFIYIEKGMPLGKAKAIIKQAYKINPRLDIKLLVYDKNQKKPIILESDTSLTYQEKNYEISDSGEIIISSPIKIIAEQGGAGGKKHPRFRELNKETVRKMRKAKPEPKIELIEALDNILKDIGEVEDLDLVTLYQTRPLEDLSQEYNVKEEKIKNIFKNRCVIKYGIEKGSQIYRKITHFKNRRHRYSDDYIRGYIELTALFDKRLPKNPNNIDFNNFKSYAEYDRQYNFPSGNSRNIITKLLFNKYSNKYGKPYVTHLLKRYAKYFTKKAGIRKANLYKTQLDVKSFLKATHKLMKDKKMRKLNVDQVLTEIGFKGKIHSKTKGKFEKLIDLLEMIQDPIKYKTIPDLYSELAKKHSITKGRVREYLSWITEAIADFRDLRGERGYEPRIYAKMHTLEDFALFLETEILHDVDFLEYLERVEGISLSSDTAPRPSWLNSYKYYGFLDRIRLMGFSYSEVVEYSSLELINKDRQAELGTMEHWCNIYWSLIFFRNKWHAPSYYETFSKYNKHRPDVSVMLEEGADLADYIFNKQKVTDQLEFEITESMKRNIKQMNIEYIHSTDLRNLVSHGQRGYQGKHKLEVMVLTGTEMSGKYHRDRMLRSKNEIPMMEHVLVLNKEEFAKFIALTSEAFYYESFKSAPEIYKLASFGPFKKHYYEKLEELAKINEDELKNILPAHYGEDLSREGWEAYLRDHGLLHLLKDNALPKKDTKKDPQNTLDNYLGDK